MLKRKSVQTLLLSLVMILGMCLLAAAISLTTTKPIDRPGSPPAGVPGVQVTVVNKSTPNAKPVSAITDKNGAFDLGPVPAGVCSMTLRIGDDANERKLDPSIKQPLFKGSATTLGVAEITIEGTTEGIIVRGWDFKEKKAVDLAGNQRLLEQKMMEKMGKDHGAARTTTDKNPSDILFTVDGKKRITGSVKTIG